MNESPCSKGPRNGSRPAEPGSLTDELLANVDRAYLVALRVTGSEHLAEEIVQEAYLKIVRKPDAEVQPGRFLSYFLSLVHNTAVDSIRRKEAMRKREQAWSRESARLSEGPYEIASRAEIVNAARTALAGLPLEERLAVSLCCEQGVTRREASEILSVPEQTYANHANRGLDRIRKLLAGKGFAAVAPLSLAQAANWLGVPAAPSSALAAAQTALGAVGTSVAGGLTAAASGTGWTVAGKVVLGAAILGSAGGGAYYYHTTQAQTQSSRQGQPGAGALYEGNFRSGKIDGFWKQVSPPQGASVRTGPNGHKLLYLNALKLGRDVEVVSEAIPLRKGSLVIARFGNDNAIFSEKAAERDQGYWAFEILNQRGQVLAAVKGLRTGSGDSIRLEVSGEVEHPSGQEILTSSPMNTGVVLVGPSGRIAFCKSVTVASKEQGTLKFAGPAIPVGPSKHGPVESVRIRLRAHKVNWGRDGILVWRLREEIEDAVNSAREEKPRRK